MYTAVIVIALLLPVLTVQAAPPKKHKLLKPTLNPLVAELVTIDSTCSSDPEKHLLVVQALSDAYDIAKVGEGIKPEDVAFKNYFISNSHEKPPSQNKDVDRMKQYGATVPERVDTKMVPDMIKSILTGGGNKQKFTVKCPKVTEEELCAHAFAFVVPHLEIHVMNLCPSFFDRMGRHTGK